MQAVHIGKSLISLFLLRSIKVSHLNPGIIYILEISGLDKVHIRKCILSQNIHKDHKVQNHNQTTIHHRHPQCNSVLYLKLILETSYSRTYNQNNSKLSNTICPAKTLLMTKLTDTYKGSKANFKNNADFKDIDLGF